MNCNYRVEKAQFRLQLYAVVLMEVKEFNIGLHPQIIITWLGSHLRGFYTLQYY